MKEQRGITPTSWIEKIEINDDGISDFYLSSSWHENNRRIFGEDPTQLFHATRTDDFHWSVVAPELYANKGKTAAH